VLVFGKKKGSEWATYLRNQNKADRPPNKPPCSGTKASEKSPSREENETFAARKTVNALFRTWDIPFFTNGSAG